MDKTFLPKMCSEQCAGTHSHDACHFFFGSDVYICLMIETAHSLHRTTKVPYMLFARVHEQFWCVAVAVSAPKKKIEKSLVEHFSFLAVLAVLAA
jgi:hypothetical protein